MQRSRTLHVRPLTTARAARAAPAAPAAAPVDPLRLSKDDGPLLALAGGTVEVLVQDVEVLLEAVDDGAPAGGGRQTAVS